MTGTANTHTEHFKPIPLRFGSSFNSRVAFKMRCFVDLQLGTIWRFLGPKLSTLRGNLLDVGCGEMPYRTFLPVDVDYVGIDVPQAGAFNMSGNEEVIPFDGYSVPFSDAAFDTVLCTEVLEHSPEPALLIAEIERVLKPGGKLIATVPFSARVHYAPYDYHRFSPYALAAMFRTFTDVQIEERGNEIAVIANKLIVLTIRMLKPSLSMLLRVPLVLLLLPLCVTFLLIAHVALALSFGSKDDCLGYSISARKAAG